MIAVYHKRKDIVRCLLQAGANINMQNKEGKTALMIAIERKDPVIVQELIENGADVLIKDNKGIDAYNLAMIKGNLEMARMIQEAVKEQLLKRKVASQQVLMAQNFGRQNGV